MLLQKTTPSKTPPNTPEETNEELLKLAELHQTDISPEEMNSIQQLAQEIYEVDSDISTLRNQIRKLLIQRAELIKEGVIKICQSKLRDPKTKS